MPIAWEFLLGVALFLGISPRITWRAVFITFVGFSCYALWLVVRGESSCGCFGRFQVEPKYTLILDVLVLLLAFAAVRNEQTRTGNIPSQGSAVAWLLQLCSLFAGGAIWLTAIDSIAVQKTPDGLPGVSHLARRVVVWEPKRWVGFPLAAYIANAERFAQGAWEIVLVRSSCVHCREFIRDLGNAGLAANFGIIDLEGDDALAHWRRVAQNPLVVVMDAGIPGVFVEVPYKFHVRDGIVVHAEQSPLSSPVAFESQSTNAAVTPIRQTHEQIDANQ